MEEVDGMEQRFGHLQQLLNLAISKFKENLNQEAINLFQNILEDPFINQEPLHSIRYSALISLGEARTTRSPNLALDCFEKALELLHAQVQGPLIGDNKDEEEFNLLIKMVLLTEKLGKDERQIQLLKLAVDKSPQKWKRGLEQRLKNRLEATGLSFNQLEIEQDSIESVESTDQKKEEEGAYNIQKIKIRINLSSFQTQYQNYSAWQKILAIAYVLLKIKKKYTFQTQEKLEQLTKLEEWKQIQIKFEQNRTQIELAFHQTQNQNPLDLMLIQEEKQVKFGNILKNAAEILLQQAHATIIEKFTKYQIKARFVKLNSYYEELFTLQNFDSSLLHQISVVDKTLFQQIIQPILTQVPGTMNIQMKQQISRENEVILNKLKTTLRSRTSKSAEKSRYIFHNSILRQKLNLEIEQSSIIFPNITVLVEKIIENLIIQAVFSSPQEALLSEFILRLFLNKALTLLIQQKQTAFQQILSFVQENQPERTFLLQIKGLLLELINIRIEELLAESTQEQKLAQNQNEKISVLVNFARGKILKLLEKAQESFQLVKEQQIRQYAYVMFQKLRFQCLQGLPMKALTQTKSKIMKLYSQIQTNNNALINNLDNKIKQYRRKSVNNQVRQQEIAKDQHFKQKIKKTPEFEKMSKLKNIFKPQNQQVFTGDQYIQFSIKLFQSFFARLQRQNKQVYLPQIKAWADTVNLKGFVDRLCETFRAVQSIKKGSISLQLYYKLLLNLIKLYLLNIYEDNDSAIRLIFYSVAILLQKDTNFKESLLAKSLILIWELLNYKKRSNKMQSSLRKKLYHNFINKNFRQLLDTAFCSQQMKNEQDTKIKNSLVQILYSVYSGTEFDPKKPIETIQLFAFIYRYKSLNQKARFDELQHNLMRHFKKSQKLYKERKNQVVSYCDKFVAALKLFGDVLHGKEGTKAQSQLMQILKGDSYTCQCCSQIKQTNTLFYEALITVASYNEEYPELNDASLPNYTRKFSHLDEVYYLQLLFLSPKSSENWQNLIRANMVKVQTYYDSLVGKPIQYLQPKVQFTKKMLCLAKEVLPSCKDLKTICDYYLQTLTILNIRQREYRMVLFDLQGAGMSTSRLTKQSIKKYKEGLKRTLSQLNSNPKLDVRIRALRVLQFKLKLAWISLQKEYKEDDKKDAVIIQLQDYLSPQLKVFKPNKIKEQLIEMISDIRSIVKDMKKDESYSQVMPIEEDLIIEMYAFLFRNIEWKLEKIINRLCEVIRVSSKTDQCRKLKQMQYTFNQLEFTLSIMLNGSFLSQRQKYRFRSERLQISKTQIHIYQILFQNTFAPRPEPQKQKPRESLQTFLKDKYGAPKDRNYTIQIDQQDLAYSSVEPHAVYRNSTSNSKSKQPHKKNDDKSAWQHGFADRRVPGMTIKHTAFNPQHIDLGKYFYQRLKQYMLENQEAGTRFNAIHSVIGSYSFYNLLQTLTKVMQEIHRVFTSITKLNEKETKNPRTYALALWSNSQIVLRYSGNWQKAMDMVKEAFDLDSNDIVLTHLLDKGYEKPLFPITQLYHRSIIEQMTKRWYIEHLFKVFAKANDKESIIFLLNKLLKISKGRTDSGVPSDLLVGTNIKIENRQQYEEKVQPSQNIKFYFYMFAVGTVYFVQVMKRYTEHQQMQEKYEQYLLMLITEIKARIGRQETNYYVNMLQIFRNLYEKKYDRKIKSKRAHDDGRRKYRKKIELESPVKKQNKKEKHKDESKLKDQRNTKKRRKSKKIPKRKRGRKSAPTNKSGKKKKIQKKNEKKKHKKKQSSSQSSSSSSSGSGQSEESSSSDESQLKVQEQID